MRYLTRNLNFLDRTDLQSWSLMPARVLSPAADELGHPTNSLQQWLYHSAPLLLPVL
jgi:hypothetical protein